MDRKVERWGEEGDRLLEEVRKKKHCASNEF
jgi:hypothetical protein